MKKLPKIFTLSLNGLSIKSFFLSVFLFTSFIFAQDPNWNSTLFVSPNPSPYVTDWQRNPATGSLTISYMGTGPAQYKLEFEITSSAYNPAASGTTVTYDFVSANTRVFTMGDFLDWDSGDINSELKNTIERTGMIPEGEYSLCVRAKNLQGELLTEACFDFSIIQPGPPQLIAPQDEEVIEVNQPNFIWNPVNVPPTVQVNYHIKIVELLQGQTKYRAIEANYVQHEADINSMSSYLYPVDALPLEKGKTYVWQLTAKDQDGRIISLNNGESEIWQFSYGSSHSKLGIDTLVLVQNVATLIDLHNLTATDNGMSFTLDGNCTMVLTLPDGSHKNISVSVQNLSVQKGDYANPIYFSGSVTATLSTGDLPKSLTGNFFSPQEIRFTAPNQFTIDGNFVFGTSTDVPLLGHLNYNGSQLTGNLTGSGTATNPLFQIGDSTFHASITTLSASFPTLDFTLTGSITAFGKSSGCSISNITLNNNGDFSASISCSPNKDIPLITGSTIFNLRLGSLSGSFSGNLLNTNLNYDITVSGGLLFKPTPANSFGASVTLRLQPNNFRLINFNSDINMDFANIDLGWLKWKLSNLQVKKLTYISGKWDYEIATDMQFSFPDFSNVKLPKIPNISFKPTGFAFPKLDLTNFTIPDIDFGAFKIALQGFHTSPFNFDFGNWTAGSIANMKFGWDIKFNMPNLPTGAPDALKNLNLTLHPVIENGNFNIQIPKFTFPNPLTMPLFGGVNFDVSALEGLLKTVYDGSQMVFSPNIKFDGDISLPSAFTCSGGSSKIHVNIGVDGHGRMNGTINNLVPTCPLVLGPVKLQAKNTNVIFKYDSTGQKISIDGTAGLSLDSSEVATLTMGYEILHNNLYKLDGNITNPFHYKIPSSNPVLDFLISNASITDKVLKIDGLQKFNFDNGINIDVTFDNFKIGLLDFSIKSGRVIFGMPFSLKVEGLGGSALSFKAVPSGSTLSGSTGIMIGLPNSIELSKNGLKINGSGSAAIKYNGKSVDSISAKFSNDFAFSISPFAITSGKAEFFYKNQRVAYINSSGFFPDANFFLNAVLPDKIPLPLESVAYLKIKDAGNLLVNVSNTGGIYQISTKSGQPVDLVLPGLKFTNPTNPTIKVNFSIKFNPSTGKLTDGSILAVPVPGTSNPFDLSKYGVPVKIDTLYYGKISGQYAFRLHSLLKLFDKEFSQANAINLFIGSDGKLVSNLNMNLQQNIQLVPGSDKLNLKLTHLNGSFNVDLKTSNIQFNLALDAGIKIKVDNGKEVGATATVIATQSGINIRNYAMDTSQLGEIGMDFFKMAITKIQMPRLNFVNTLGPNHGWDFEFNLDFDLQFPSLGFHIPKIQGVTLTKTGLHFPNISLPNFPDSLKFQYGGFEFKPLAFRLPSLNINWFSSTPVTIDWSQLKFDFAVNFPNISNGGGLMQTPGLTIRNASFSNGILIGNVSKTFNQGDLRLNFGGSFGFSVTKITGGLYNNSGSQGVKFGLNGILDLPAFMQCGTNTTADVSTVSFELDSKGLIAGSVNNFVPSCPINLGFGKFTVTHSNINFSIANNAQSAILDMSGNLKIPTGSGSNVTAGGALKLNLITGQISDGQIAINQPFSWGIPYDKPVFKFTIGSAVLNKNGLMINGSSQLNLEGGASQTVQFNHFLFDYMNLKVKDGDITINGNIGLKLSLPASGGINWSVIGQHDTLTTNKSAMIGFGGSVVIDTNGVHTNGSANAAVRWDAAHIYKGLSVTFPNQFAMKINPFEVSKGEADLMLNSERIAYLDNGGFHLGNIFGLIPIPEKLALPDTNIAYIKIKNGSNVLLETNQSGSDLQLKTKSGQPVVLFIPALKQGTNIPHFNVTFDITVNTSTWSLVTGGITVESPSGSPPILDLDSLIGIPVQLRKVSYTKVGGSYKLATDARLKLPDALGGMPVDLKGLSFDAHGITGNVNVGQYSLTKLSGAPVLAKTTLSDVRFTLEGASASFGTVKAFKLSGNIVPLMMVNGTDTTKIHYAAEWNSSSKSFVFGFDFTPGTKFNFGVADFYPQAIAPDPAMKLSFSGSNFEFMLGGTLKIPSFDPNFAIAFSGLKINNSGVSVDAVHIPDAAQALQFELFNSKFRVYDSYPSSEAISFAYVNKILSLTLTGDLNVLNHTVKFKGFKVSTDGKISVQSLNLLDTPVEIVQNYLSLDTLAIRNVSDQYRLGLAGHLNLPKSVAQTSSFHFGFEIGTNGHVYSNSTDNRVVFLNEPQQLGHGDKSEYTFWKATIDPTYLDLGLNFSDMGQSYVRMLGNIYWDNKESNRVDFGKRNADGTISQPAFKLTLNGNITWGDITVTDTLRFDWNMLKLGLSRVTIHPSSDSMFIQMSGYFGINIASVTGRISISDLKINKNGVEDFGRISGAQLKVANIISLQLDSLVYKNNPTTITVKSGSMPGSGDGGGDPNSENKQIHVKNYFAFSGSISVAKTLSGGIKRFMTYTTMDDNFNLLIEDAFLKYSTVFEMHMDLVYKTQGSDYYLLAGATGKVLTYNIIVIGQVGHLNGKDRFGFFIAADVNIPIGPVTIAQIGGGFFYNPTGETINTIKRLANLDDTGGANDKIKPGDDNTKIAIFLFGKFTLVSDAVVAGKVLLTLTDKQFYLDGKVVLLNQKNSIYGSIHLAVDFENAEFEGNIKIDVNLLSLIKGHGEIGAFIYGSDKWAVYGNTDVKVLNYIDVKSDFFVGPSGFLVSFTSISKFDIWIIDIEGGLEAKVWYFDTSWGLYAKVWIKVEVLGGVAGAKGWLKGALFGTQNDFFMYGVAGLKVHLLFVKWKGSVWGKIKNGHASGGFGADSDMEKMIEDAGKTAEKAEQAKDDMKNDISSHTVPTHQFSNEELASAFDNLSKLGRIYRYGNTLEKVLVALVFGSIENIEHQGRYYSSTLTNQETTVHNYCVQTYMGNGAPDLQEMQQQNDFINSLIARFNTARSNLLNTLNQNMDQIETVVANIKEAGESPVTGENFAPPTRKDTNGDGHPDQVTSMPGFQFDESVANENKSNLQDSQNEIADYEHKIFVQIGNINKNIIKIENIISGQSNTSQSGSSGNSGSSSGGTTGITGSGFSIGGQAFLNGINLTPPSINLIPSIVPVDRGAEGYAEGYVSYYHSIDAAFVTQYNYYRGLSRWAAGRLNTFTSNATFITFKNRLIAKANAIYNTDWRGLKFLSANRLYIISLLSSENNSSDANTAKQNEKSAWDNNHTNLSASAFKTWAIDRNVTLGMNLWIDIPKNGLPNVVSVSRSKSDSTVQNKYALLSTLSNAQASVTQKLNVLYGYLATLVELKYDLYDKLLERRNSSSEYIDSSVATNYLITQKQLLANRMKLPVISSLSYNATDKGFYSDVKLEWNITGTGAEKAKSMVDFSSTWRPRIVSAGKQAVGGLRDFRLLYTPKNSQINNNTVSFGSTTFKLYVKNELGYVIRKNITFTPVCSNSPSGTGGGAAGSAGTDTTPPIVSTTVDYPYDWTLSPVNGHYVRVYYTSDTANVSASWNAYDNDSGIRDYRYTFFQSQFGNTITGGGSSGLLGGNNLGFIPPLPGFGGGTSSPYSTWTDNYGRKNTEIHGLQLLHKHYYKLYVVAQNGDNLWSKDTSGIDQYLKVDTTPPTYPQPLITNLGGGIIETGNYISGGHRYQGNDNTSGIVFNFGGGFAGGFGSGFGGGFTYTVNPVIPLPSNVNSGSGSGSGGYGSGLGNGFGFGGVTPLQYYNNSNISEKFSWKTASDNESGIRGYEYRVVKTNDPTKTSEWIDNGNNLSVTLRNDITGMNNIMTYLDTFYLDVRSINRANKRSEQMLRIQFQPVDKSAPTKPEVNMAYSSDHSRVYLIFTTRSTDAETGIDHYEIAVGSQSNGTFDYVSWDDSMFISLQSIGSNNAVLLPILPNHTKSYIAIRAVNQQGLKGPICYTGPYYNDSTPPVTPVVSISQYNMISNIYLLTHYSSLSDPETGISSVYYKIEKITYSTSTTGGSGGSSGGGFSFGGGNSFGNGSFNLGGGGNTILVPHYSTVVDWKKSDVTGAFVQINNLGLTHGSTVRVSIRAKNGAFLYSNIYSTTYLVQ